MVRQKEICEEKIQKFWALIYALFCSQVVPEKHGGLMAIGSKVLLGIFLQAKFAIIFGALLKKE